MKKFLLLSLLIVLVSPALLSAEGGFSLGVGSISQFQRDPFSSDIQYATVIDVRNWISGWEVRLRLGELNIDAHVFSRQGEIVGVTETGHPVFADDVSQRIFGMASAGFSTEVAAFTTLSFGVGTSFGLDVGSHSELSYWMGERGNVYDDADPYTFLANITAEYRMRFDLNLGGCSIGVYYQVPSQGFSYANPRWPALKADWDRGRVGASFITILF